MQMLDLFNNPILKKTLFKQLRKACEENGVTAVVVIPDSSADGGFRFDMYKEEMKIMPMADFIKLIQSIEL
jgi:hypothetical protein